MKLRHRLLRLPRDAAYTVATLAFYGGVAALIVLHAALAVYEVADD